MVDGKTPTEWETELSVFNKKTLDSASFKQYLQKKNEVNSKLMRVYEQHIFRKLKWSSYINTRKSEQKMLAGFRETFGSPDEVVVGFGDWEQRKKHAVPRTDQGEGNENTSAKGWLSGLSGGRVQDQL